MEIVKNEAENKLRKKAGSAQGRKGSTSITIKIKRLQRTRIIKKAGRRFFLNLTSFPLFSIMRLLCLLMFLIE